MKRSLVAAWVTLAALTGTNFSPPETKRPTSTINPRNREERIRKAQEKRDRKNAARLARKSV